MKKILTYILVMLMLAFVSFTPARAQYNATHMDQKYSEWYDKAKLDEYANALKKQALENNDFYAYYTAYNLKIMNQLQYGHTLDALTYAKEMADYSRKTHSAFGQFCALYSLGNVYDQRQEYTKSIAILDSALTLIPAARKEYKDLKTSATFNLLANAHRSLRQFDKAESTFNAGLSQAVDRSDSLLLLTSCASMFGALNKKEQFDSLYKEATSKGPISATALYDPNAYYFMQAYHNIFNGQYEKAETYISKVTDESERARAFRTIYAKQGDFFKALEYERELIAIDDSIHNKLTNQDVIQLNKQLNNSELKQKAEKQAADLLHMKILRAQTEYEQIEMNARTIELQEEAEKKQAHEEELRAKAMLYETQKKRLEQEEDKQRLAESYRQTQFINTIMYTLLFIFSAAIVVILIWMNRSRKTAKKLSMLTKELTIAQKKALETNNIKTLFIQNMSHDIRTQLNTVTGFAQILSSKDIVVSEEERLEYGKHIAQNAQILNELIDDILDNCRKSDIDDMEEELDAEK